MYDSRKSMALTVHAQNADSLPPGTPGKTLTPGSPAETLAPGTPEQTLAGTQAETPARNTGTWNA